MPTDTSSEVRSVNREALATADFQFAVPFALPLEQAELYVEKIVRLLPGKRMVVFGTWRGVPVVAKLFYDKKRGIRHYAKDLAGIRAMVDYKIPTPALAYAGQCVDQQVQVILLERLENAINLEERWQQHETLENMVPWLHALMIEIATQHVLGVRQLDMHLGNFLLARNTIFTLDGAQIDIQKEMLSRQDSIENVALLLSQLGAGVETLQHSLFLHYAKARGWLLKPADMTEVMYQIKQCDVLRWKHYQKKIFRDSTDFVRSRRMGWRGMVRRDALGSEMQAFLQNPDSVFQREDMVMLKKGRSSTVIGLQLDGKDVVVKRYNMKSIWHRARRMFRASRAEHCWRLAYKMRLFHLNTPQPLAYIESNWLGVRGKAYLVTELVRGPDVKQYLTPHANQLYSVANVIHRVCNLIKSLARIEVTHGDLKATNIIINHEAQPYLIDLDGAAEHFSLSGLRRTTREEVQRFLRNFDDVPTLHEVLQRSLRV